MLPFFLKFSSILITTDQVRKTKQHKTPVKYICLAVCWGWAHLLPAEPSPDCPYLLQGHLENPLRRPGTLAFFPFSFFFSLIRPKWATTKQPSAQKQWELAALLHQTSFLYPYMKQTFSSNKLWMATRKMSSNTYCISFATFIFWRRLQWIAKLLTVLDICKRHVKVETDILY